MELYTVIERHTIPTRYDSFPRYTLCRSLITNDDGEEECLWYVQVSADKTAEWITLGEFMARYFIPSLEKNMALWPMIAQKVMDLAENID